MKVFLRFSSIGKLWEFRTRAGIHVFDIYTETIVLSCHCTVEEIQMAVKEYEAVIIENGTVF